MTEKRFKFRRFDVDVKNINEIALYEIDNNPSDDLDESNLFYAYSTTHANIQDIVDKLNNQEERIKELEKENEHIETCFKMADSTYHILQKQYHNIEIALSKYRKENEKLKNALKNSYLNEICENCKYGHYFRSYNYGGFEGDFECKKGHDGANCDGLKECDDFELRY